MLAEQQPVGAERRVGTRVDSHRVDPERADGALLDQPAHGRWAKPRVVQPARGIRVQVGRRVVPAVLEASPHDDGAVRRDRPEFRLPALYLGDAEGEVRVLLYLGPHVEHDRGVEEVAGIELVRGGLVRGEVRGRGPVRARLLAGQQGLQVVAVPPTVITWLRKTIRVKPNGAARGLSGADRKS